MAQTTTRRLSRTVLAIFVAVFVLNALGTFLMVQSIPALKRDATIINIAGRERMLTQRMTKEAMLLRDGRGSPEQLQRTVKLFDESLTGLLGGDEGLRLRPCVDEAAAEQLQLVRELWNGLHPDMDRLVATKGLDAEAMARLLDKERGNTALLNEVNRAVTLLEDAAHGRGRKLRQLQMAELILVLCLLASAWILVVHPLARRLRSALRDLKRKNDELERFGYALSHDLKGPVTTILGYTSLIEDFLKQGRTEEAATGLGRIKKSAHTLTEMITHLLELARMGAAVSSPTKFCFKDVTQEALSRIAMQVEGSNAVIRIDESSPEVSGDRECTVRAIQNLIDNAIKYAQDGVGPVVRIVFRKDAGRGIAVVKDNGIGIPGECHEDVFRLFTQLDKSAPGMGVGLSSARRIARAQGGDLWVESVGEEAGAAFCLALPLAA